MLADGPTVVDQRPIVYRRAGPSPVRLRRLGRQGGARVAFDLGPDRPGLEVVSTHLLAGDDLPSPHRHVEGQLSRRRRRQVEELLAFVEEHVRDGAVQVVAGDFNIEAEHHRRWLVDRSPSLGFVDAGAEVGDGDGRTVPDGRIDYVFVRGADGRVVPTCSRPTGHPDAPGAGPRWPPCRTTPRTRTWSLRLG